MAWLIPLFFVFSIGTIVLVIVFSIRAQRRRKEAMQEFAAQRGLAFDERGQAVQALDLPEMDLFRRAGRHGIRFAVVGEIEGMSVAIFDYRYTTGSGKNRSTHVQTVVAVGLPEDGSTGEAAAFEAVPAFTLRREHLFDGIGAWFGYEDVDFPDAPEFSKAFKLLAPGGRDAQSDPEVVARLRGAFNDEAIAFFMQGPGAKWQVESSGRWLCVYEPSRSWKVEDWSKRLDEAFDLLMRLCR